MAFDAKATPVYQGGFFLRYARAMASGLELTDAELAYTQAQSNYPEAVYDYLSANIEVERTMGVVGKY